MRIKEKSELGTETRVQSVLGKTTETRHYYKDKSWNLILTSGTHQLPGQCLHSQLLRCLFSLGQGLVLQT